MPERHNLFISLLRQLPRAAAVMTGSAAAPFIRGLIRFYPAPSGVLVAAEINGLPRPTEPCEEKIFALHIHDGEACTGNATDPFAAAMGHYNPDGCLHPFHAGDLPPLFSNNGYAFLVFLTDRFTLSEVMGKTVILHDRPDDFTTQPSGNAGSKIACGIIRPVGR